MTFRITPQSTIGFNLRNLAQQQSRLAQLQRQISSGVRVQKPSDDPLQMRRSLLLKDAQARLEAHLRSLNDSRSRLEQATSAVQEAKNLYVQAQRIALEGRQATDAVDFKILASEVESLLDQLQRLANTADVAGALFGGTAVDTEPYPALTGEAPPSYAGAGTGTRMILGDQPGTDLLAPGSSVFDPGQRRETLVEGATGVAGGSGTPTATGVRTLSVIHTGTTYAGSSGVQPGSSAAAQDTLIGTHQLQIVDVSGTGASGTIALNGGTPVEFTSADSDLLVTGPTGEKIYVDTRSITAGFSGSVTVQAEGALSIDDGATYTPITFEANQTVHDSRDGSVAYLDTRGATRVGADRIEFLQTPDAFQTLALLRDDLLEAAQLSASERVDRLGRRLQDVQRVQDHLTDQIGEHSIKLQNLERLQTLFDERSFQVQSELSDRLGTDIPQAVLEMQQAQSLLQYTYATMAQLFSNSFINFLR